ncbi:MAG: argininosuccinate lyase, partial [bacterium]
MVRRRRAGASPAPTRDKTRIVTRERVRSTRLLWGGRFSRGPSARTLAFTQSLDLDKRLAPQDIAGSIAHARMLGKVGLLTRAEAARLVRGLEKVGRQIASGKFRFVPTDEDIHTAVERGLGAVVGQALAGKLHAGRSRNDQVALDLRLYMRERLDAERRLIGGVIRSLVGQAEKHPRAVMPGYTHLQPAQPVLFAHHLLAYGFMLKRDAGRLADCAARLDECPLGSAALAGTSLPLDRAHVANLLGFRRVTENSLDAVSDRDAVLEYMAAAAILMTHLSRLAEELVRWSSPAYGFIEMADEFCTGSSIMPQKKNPDVAELIRAKGAGRTAATLVEALTAMKGLPLAYNRDLQEVNVHRFVTGDVV